MVRHCGTLRARSMVAARSAWLLVPLIGIVELVAHGVFASRAPSQEDWASLPAAVERLRRPGDLVVVAPEWADPIARQTLGEAVMPLADVARADTSGHRHAIEVSVLGQRSAELASFRELERVDAGPFRLRRLENTRYVPVLYRFDDHVTPDALAVSVLDPSGSVEACAFTDRALATAGGLGGHPAYPRARFRCPGGEWSFVGVTVIDDERYRPRRCIFAHPAPHGGVLRLDFDAVPSGRVLRGYAGLPYLVFRDGIGTPVTLRAFVDDEAVGQSVHDDRDGFTRFEFRVPPRTAPEMRVRFEVTSPDASARHFCFTASLG